MLCFPNAKINLGLNITEKRPDGFHNLQTVFYPVSLCDVLEFVESDGDGVSVQFQNTGIETGATQADNLCVKAYELLKKDFDLPLLKIHLHKMIPVGAGLGGGSSDAAYMLTALNKAFNLALTEGDLMDYASQLGSDCAFFIHSQPSYAWNRGDNMHEISLDLHQYYLILVFPNIHISTAAAYSSIKPAVPAQSPEKVVNMPVEEWRYYLTNDFEPFVFSVHPEIEEIKQKLYNMGADYAAMSGSGSAVYGLFRFLPEKTKEHFDGYFVWKGKL